MVWILVLGCRCARSWCSLDLTSDLAVVTLKYWGGIHYQGLRSDQNQIKFEKKVSSEPVDQIAIHKAGIT